MNSLDFDTINILNSISGLTSGIGQGIVGAYGNKTRGYKEIVSMYNQSIPLYQQISAKTQELQTQQAMAYLNSGVDISKGTASYVIKHTTKQGNAKMAEISQNLAIESKNAKKIGGSNAITSLFSGIVEGVSSSMNTITNYQLYKLQHGNTGKKSNKILKKENIYKLEVVK